MNELKKAMADCRNAMSKVEKLLWAVGKNLDDIVYSLEEDNLPEKERKIMEKDSQWISDQEVKAGREYMALGNKMTRLFSECGVKEKHDCGHFRIPFNGDPIIHGTEWKCSKCHKLIY